MTNNILEEGLGDDQAWDPRAETIQAHYSSLNLHRKCPNAWYFRYGLNLSKPLFGPAPYLHFGSWYGLWRSAEALERGRKAGSLVFDPRKFKPIDYETGPEFDQATLTTQDVMDAADAWWKVQSHGPEGPEVEASWQDTLGGTLRQRLEATTVRWRDEFGDAAKYESPLGIEVFWKRELPRATEDLAEPSDYEGESLPNVVLIGFIDELYRDEQRNMIVVRDNKTSSRMEPMTVFSDMVDSQLFLYGWGVTPKLKSIGVETPRAMAYDRILSKATAKPGLNLDGTLSAKSKIWDLRTYRDWVAEGQEFPGRSKDGSGAGTYVEDPELAKRLGDPNWKVQFIQRTLTPISRPAVTAHLRAAVDSATDIWRTTRRAERTHEAARNLTKDNCRWCDYAAICRARMFSGPEAVYDLREFGLVGKNGHLLQGNQTTREIGESDE